MASMEPSDSEISEVADFTSLQSPDDRPIIRRALRSNNRDTSVVIGQYFDNPDSFRNRYRSDWDDSMFAADRDGNDNNTGISFHIESPNQNDVIHGVTPPPESYGMGAPSRPPSRSNNRSPLGRIIDWTAADAPGTFPRGISDNSLTEFVGAPNSQAQEDEDIERAIRMSAQEAGMDMAQHETGVVDTSTSASHFGRANRSDYESGNWAMVPVSTSNAQLKNAPAPSLRRRAVAAPAFLVQGNSTVGDHRLGGLLTILHEIPLARNTLLDSGEAAASYGHNSEWWNGQEILPPHVLNQLQSGELSWEDSEQTKPNFDEELHRLMAFLDSTERSYGTVSIMTDITPSSDRGAEKQFYENLGYRNGNKFGPLMQVASLAYVQGDDPGYEVAKFGLLEMEHPRFEYTYIKTLYESLDHVMWNDVLSWHDCHEGSKMALLKEIGEVLVMRIGSDGPEDSIDIPEEFYPERYLDTRKDEARRIQLAWGETKTAMIKIADEERKLYSWQDKLSDKKLDKRELLKTAGDQWRLYQEYLEGLARFQTLESMGFDTATYPEYRSAPCNMDSEKQALSSKVEEIIQYTEGLLAHLDEKLQGLQTQMQQLQAKQRFLGRLLTVPDKPGRPKPMTCKKYLLRGVATSKDVIYVCQRAEADLIEFDDKPKQQQDQWWRLAYVPSNEQSVTAERVEIERVLRDMWQETKTPLLVYATETALETARAPLCSALERFVKADNKAFRQEINQEKAEANERKKSGPIDPISPSKRKHRSESFDSMDSNRASLGSDDRNGFENPFADQNEGNSTGAIEISRNASDFARSVDVESPIGNADQPSASSSCKMVSEGNTPTTVTPSTMNAEDLVFDKSQQGPQADTGLTTPGVEEARSPEMQERARPPSFIASPLSKAEQKQPIGMMDMEIPEHHE